MRWQRPVRYGVALLGLGVAAAVVVYSRNARRPVIENPPVVLTDPKVSARGSGIVKFRKNFAKGNESIKIEADIETAYTNGKTRLERAHFTSEKEDGKTFEIWAGLAESEGKAVTGDEPGLMHLSGGVRTRTNDGLEVNTDAATYDNIQGLATIPGKLTFTRGRMSGGGVGATYDRERDVLWLLDEAHVKRERGPDGTGALDASAKSIGVARPDRYMNLREHARIVQPDQTLSGDQLVVHFTEDEKGAQLLEMHGNARVTPAVSAKKGAPDMQSDDITLEFHPDGQTLRHAMLAGRARVVQITDQGRQTISATTIDLLTAADGRTLVNVEARGGDVETVLPPTADKPERTIRAASLVASGDDAGLKAAVFDGSVRFVEGGAGRGARAGAARGPAPSERTATSDSLALSLAGQLGAIQKAEFRQKVTFKDGSMTATADLAVHDETLGTLVLTPPAGPGRKAVVDDTTVRVEAQWIQVAMNTHDLRAKDNIYVLMSAGKSATGGQAHSPALFDGAKPIRGIGTNLKYTTATREAIIAGSPTVLARVYQGDTGAGSDLATITANEQIELNQDNGNLKARGQVESQFMLDRAEPSAGRGRPAAAAAKAAPAAAGAPASAVAPKSKSTIVKAAQMEYVDATRKATYASDAPKAGEVQKLATLIGPDDNIEAKEIVLTLAASERALKTLEATGSMWATFEGGREAIGARMVYDAVTEKHVITGAPMYFKNVQLDAGKKSCTLETSTELIYEGKDQTINEPVGPAKSSRPSRSMVCETPLKTFVATPVVPAK